MAKSLSNIMSQIERLQKEAAAIQTEVIARIRKEIAKYGLTAEQLFGKAPLAKSARSVKQVGRAANEGRPPKYADSAGNTWSGRGNRPAWLRAALAEGRLLDDFLVGKQAASPLPKAVARKQPQVKPKTSPAGKVPPKKRTSTKAVARKGRAKAATASSTT